MLFHVSYLLAALPLHAQALKYQGPDYEAPPPLDTIFPGPWESYIRAPLNKAHITPVSIFHYEGATAGAESVLQDASAESGVSWVISSGGLITFELQENISGRVCFDIRGLKNDPYLVLSYSESPLLAGREPDTTGDRRERDLPLKLSITHTGINCVGPGYIRGAFKYLTVYIPETDLPTQEGFWHDEDSEPKKQVVFQGQTDQQQALGSSALKDDSKDPIVWISSIWVNCTAFPSNPIGRAYTGYFDSSSSLLNRIWYAGAWTLQLCTIDPKEGSSDIDYNRNFDHNDAPQGAWYSNYTIANGTTVIVDGAKRDRMVWPGDMTIAVPGIAVSTYDMLAVRNALDAIYEHQYGDGSMPYAGPPMGALGEFSDTYHLHTLIGTYLYVLYSGDIQWLKKRWSAYVKALEVSVAKVDHFNLLHVSSANDWIRPGMTGHNVEASALLYAGLGNSIKLSSWISEEEKNGETSKLKPVSAPSSNFQGFDKQPSQRSLKSEENVDSVPLISNSSSQVEHWANIQARLMKGISTLYCKQDGLYSDNKGLRSCAGPEKVLPQDGNSWVLISHAFTSPLLASTVSQNLRARWLKHGAPAVEFPNVISPFASSFELLAHMEAGNVDAATELMELMWGYMLDGEGMTNSTLLEGYRVDGDVGYPAYWSKARNSHAHGWATGPTSVLMQGVLGIKLLSPLGREWEIEPCLTKWLSWARGGFATKLGRFEVVVELMRNSAKRKMESLEISYPEGSRGLVKWGGEVQVRDENMPAFFKVYRFLDPILDAEGEGWQAWTSESDKEFVSDDTWVKPDIQERPEGIVDWEKLEEGYAFASERYASSSPE